MRTRLRFDIAIQPDNTTCGPTCLTSVYRFYKDDIPHQQVIKEVPTLETGGTLAVLMANHALKRGYLATLYTYNLQVFDPTWFDENDDPVPDIIDKLVAQANAKGGQKLKGETKAYIEFLRMGGRLRSTELTPGLIRRYLKKKLPILAGLSATYLYRCAREIGVDPLPDDIRGEPSGHFVVLAGYDKAERTILVADPLYPNPLAEKHTYEVSIDRAVSAILLGILTHDANLLVIQPNHAAKKVMHADPAHRR